MAIKGSLSDSGSCKPGVALSRYMHVLDRNRDLKQIKKPIGEIDALLDHVEQVYKYLDGLTSKVELKASFGRFK